MKSFTFAALACFALVAHAAEPASVGKVDMLAGSVSVGNQGTVAPAKLGMPVYDGSTVLVSAKGKTTVVLNNGCTIDLRGSQLFTVDSKLDCKAAIASVKTLAGTAQVAAAPASMSGAAPFVGAAIGGALLINSVSETRASGS